MPYFEIIIFVVAGLIGGFMAGMLGVGGGIVFVPVIQQVLLVFKVGDDFVAYTLANSLAIVFFVGITGSYKQIKLKNTHLPSALVTGIGAIITSVSITFIVNYFHLDHPLAFKIIFGSILVFSATRMFLEVKKKSADSRDFVMPELKKFMPAGLFAGFVTALSGLGGGIVMVPYFNKVLKLPIRFATGLSLTVIPIIALPLLVFYSWHQPTQLLYPGYQTGHLIWPVLLPITLGAMVASQFGIKVAQRMKSQTLKIVFLVFIILNLLKLIFV